MEYVSYQGAGGGTVMDVSYSSRELRVRLIGSRQYNMPAPPWKWNGKFLLRIHTDTEIRIENAPTRILS